MKLILHNRAQTHSNGADPYDGPGHGIGLNLSSTCVARSGKALGYRSGGHAFEPCHRTYTLCIVGYLLINPYTFVVVSLFI